MSSAYCPDCDEKINLRNPKTGQKLFCPYCEAELEVISTNPLDLDWAYDYSDDEDWADEEDD